MISGAIDKIGFPSLRMVIFFVFLGSPFVISILYYDNKHPCRSAAEEIIRYDSELSSGTKGGNTIRRRDAFYFESEEYVDDVKYVYEGTFGGRRTTVDLIIRGDCKSGDFVYEIAFL